MQYSYFSVILGSLMKQCFLFEIFLHFFAPPALTPYKVETPTPLVGWGERLGLCELENAPEMQKCPKTFVHECSSVWLQYITILYNIVSFIS